MTPHIEKISLTSGEEEEIHVRQCQKFGFYFEEETPIDLKIGEDGDEVSLSPPVIWESPMVYGGQKIEPVTIFVTSTGNNEMILETWN